MQYNKEVRNQLYLDERREILPELQIGEVLHGDLVVLAAERVERATADDVRRSSEDQPGRSRLQGRESE